MSAWTPEREADLSAMWQRKPRSVRRIADELGTSVGAIYRQARKIGLDVPKRTVAHPPLRKSHPAIRQSRPRHAKRLVTAETSPRLFVQGKESRKIGQRVTKGRWAGMPLYTLTLAERITCPHSCLNWTSCYGNNLNWPRRHILDRDLIERMRWELTALNARHSNGFVIRLHVLGDFGSDADVELAAEYAWAWLSWLERFDALRVFGFTAWAPDTSVGRIVDQANKNFADRWRVRFSGHALDGRGALVVERPQDSVHVLCPWDAGKVKNCGSCALCWTMDRTVEFGRH
jgi:hypothetical protein